MTRSEVLRRQLEAAFPLRDIDITIGNHVYRLTTAEDIEALISRITEEEFRQDERLPYWAELWHSAVALAVFLVEKPARVHGRRVLEIGCGLALPGIVAASMGAEVTCSDFEAHALTAAEYNMRQNVPEARSAFRYMDFREPGSERWPVILAADVIYEKRFVEALVVFLDRVLEDGGTIFLAEPNRLIAIPFFEALTARGFAYTRHARSTELHGRAVEISVYEIARRGTRAAAERPAD